MTFLIFFIIIALLILSHEFGHFLVAKLTNTKVEEFGFGFPPKIFWLKKGETIYSFNLFPIGGFVKILGEDGAPPQEVGLSNLEIASPNNRNFFSKPVSVKAAIIAGGVFFNLLLAWILISASLSLGSLQQIDDNLDFKNAQVMIAEVQKNSPAEVIGLRPGDQIFRLSELTLASANLEVSAPGNFLEPTKMTEVQDFVNLNRGKKIEITYKREDKIFSSKIQLRDAAAKEGGLGIAMARVAMVKEKWHAAIFKGLKQTILLTGAIALAIIYFIIGLFRGTGFEQVAGPIGIFNIVGQTSQFGISHLIQLSALLSINLAIINFLPFPALDGGRLIFVLIEKIKGSPLNYKVVNLIHSVGFAILIILMLFVTYQDILRLM